MHIVEIVKKPNKYEIYMTNSHIDGLMIGGSGFVRTNSNRIEICQEKDKEDYETISDFIHQKPS